MSMEREKKGEGGGIGGEDCALPIAESTLVFLEYVYIKYTTKRSESTTTNQS